MQKIQIIKLFDSTQHWSVNFLDKPIVKRTIDMFESGILSENHPMDDNQPTIEIRPFTKESQVEVEGQNNSVVHLEDGSQLPVKYQQVFPKQLLGRPIQDPSPGRNIKVRLLIKGSRKKKDYQLWLRGKFESSSCFPALLSPGLRKTLNFWSLSRLKRPL